MSEEQTRRPLTYGDVFPAAAVNDVTGFVASQPITPEDASLMQSAESIAFGRTQKGGAASVMQAAAAMNVREGLVDRDAHSLVAESGVVVAETAVPGVVMDVEYAAGVPLHGVSHPAPTDPPIAALDAITIGEALEAAAVNAGDKPIDANDARAIMSAEARATGSTMLSRGGLGAVAQSAAEMNPRLNESEKTTLSDLLAEATSDLPRDKVVTREDAQKVLEAEMRGKDELQPGGVGASLLAAADMNTNLLSTPVDVGAQLTQGYGVDVVGDQLAPGYGVQLQVNTEGWQQAGADTLGQQQGLYSSPLGSDNVQYAGGLDTVGGDQQQGVYGTPLGSDDVQDTGGFGTVGGDQQQGVYGAPLGSDDVQDTGGFGTVGGDQQQLGGDQQQGVYGTPLVLDDVQGTRGFDTVGGDQQQQGLYGTPLGLDNVQDTGGSGDGEGEDTKQVSPMHVQLDVTREGWQQMGGDRQAQNTGGGDQPQGPDGNLLSSENVQDTGEGGGTEQPSLMEGQESSPFKGEQRGVGNILVEDPGWSQTVGTVPGDNQAAASGA